MEGGFRPEASRALVGELFFLLAHAAEKRSEESFSRLSREYSTAGGLNEQAWRELQAAGWSGQIQAALDLVLDRIYGRATFDTRLPQNRVTGGSSGLSPADKGIKVDGL